MSRLVWRAVSVSFLVAAAAAAGAGHWAAGSTGEELPREYRLVSVDTRSRVQQQVALPMLPAGVSYTRGFIWTGSSDPWGA